jgi:hypothetical protein
VEPVGQGHVPGQVPGVDRVGDGGQHVDDHVGAGRR